MDDSTTVAFSERQAERLTGLSTRRLRYWESTGFFAPSFLERDSDPHSGAVRVYSFRDIVALRTLESLRVRNGVSLQHLRKVAERLSAEGLDVWVQTTLWVVDHKVVFQPEDPELPREVVSGQYVIKIPLATVVDDTQAAIIDIRRRKKDEIGCIRKRSGIAGGAVFAGTRIRAISVQRLHEDGYNAEQTRAEYPDLTDEDIHAALVMYQKAA